MPLEGMGGNGSVGGRRQSRWLRTADGFAVWRRATPKRASIAPGDFASHVTLLYICCCYVVA
jgi:hypothetical protein